MVCAARRILNEETSDEKAEVKSGLCLTCLRNNPQNPEGCRFACKAAKERRLDEGNTSKKHDLLKSKYHKHIHKLYKELTK